MPFPRLFNPARALTASLLCASMITVVYAEDSIPVSMASGIEVTSSADPEPASAAELTPATPVQAADSSSQETPPPTQVPASPVLTLEMAIQRTLDAHPALAELELEYLALDNEAWQAGRKPNPELELELSGFGGTAEATGIDALEAALTYTQEVERGGKRSKRETAAALARELVAWDIAQLEHELSGQVRLAYAAALTQQQELAWLREYEDLLKLIYATVAQQVEAGRNARLELERLEVELARLKLEISIAERSLAQARQELAGLWGGTAESVGAFETPVVLPNTVPELAVLESALAAHPDLARLDAEYDAQCAVVDLENANGVPDAAWFGGLSRANDADETVFSVGLSFELPWHDGNEGAISAAGHRLAQVEEKRAATWRELSAELASLRLTAVSARASNEAYEVDLIPASRDVLALMEEGYRYGKFELLDVLDAQRTVQELEREQAQAQAELLLAMASLEALLGTEFAGLAVHTAASTTQNMHQSTESKEYSHEIH